MRTFYTYLSKTMIIVFALGMFLAIPFSGICQEASVTGELTELEDQPLVKLYPNPCSDYFVVEFVFPESQEFDVLQPAVFRLFALDGPLVMEELLLSTRTRMEGVEMIAGLYTYEILYQDEVVGKGRLVLW